MSEQLLARLQAQAAQRRVKLQGFLQAAAARKGSALSEASNRAASKPSIPRNSSPGPRKEQDAAQVPRAPKSPTTGPKGATTALQQPTPRPSGSWQDSNLRQCPSRTALNSREDVKVHEQALQLRNQAIERLSLQLQREQQAWLQTLGAALALQQTLLAAMHYSRRLLRTHGLQPWRRLIQLRRHSEQQADAYRDHSQVRAAYRAWRAYLQQARWAAVCSEACSAAQHRLQRQREMMAAGLAAFALSTRFARARSEAALGLWRRHLASKAYAAWRNCVLEVTAHQAQLQARADGHWRLQHSARAWAAWRRGLIALRQEAQLQRRQEAQWARVQEWLREGKRDGGEAGVLRAVP